MRKISRTHAYPPIFSATALAAAVSRGVQNGLIWRFGGWGASAGYLVQLVAGARQPNTGREPARGWQRR